MKMPLFESVDRIMDFVGSKGEIGAMKKITILGSTGSIGTQALDIMQCPVWRRIAVSNG